MFMLLKAKQLFFGPRTFPLIKKENFYHLKTVLNFDSDKVILNDMIPFNCGKKRNKLTFTMEDCSISSLLFCHYQQQFRLKIS